MNERSFHYPPQFSIFSNFSCLSDQLTIPNKDIKGYILKSFAIGLCYSNQKKGIYIKLKWCSTVLCIIEDQGLSYELHLQEVNIVGGKIKTFEKLIVSFLNQPRQPKKTHHKATHSLSTNNWYAFKILLKRIFNLNTTSPFCKQNNKNLLTSYLRKLRCKSHESNSLHSSRSIQFYILHEFVPTCGQLHGQ